MQTKTFKTILVIFVMTFSITGSSQDIFTAIVQGDFNTAKHLIESDSANAITKNPRGFSPIHFAANFNQLEIAKLLVEYGANPFEVGTFGRQPIHWAAATGSYELMLWLHKLGADLNAKDANNQTPVYLAAVRGHKKNVEYLLSQNVDIQTEGDGAFELFYFSATLNLQGIIEKFIQSDFDFKETTDDGSNLLMAAALGGNIELVKKCAERGLDLNLLNDFGECALHIAIQKNNEDMVKTLLKLGADVNIENFNGQNALGIARKNEASDLVNYLISKGAKTPNPIVLDKKYPGFKMPGLTPELLAPGLISTPDFEERDVMFSPDFKEFYFTKYSRTTAMPMTVQLMTRTNGEWSAPAAAKSFGKFNAAECFITHDNKNIYFISQRPPDGGDAPTPWEIWIADRIDNEWANFRLFDTTQLKGCFYPSLTKTGEMLYTGLGNDLYLAKLMNGKVVDPIKLGPEINTEAGEYNAMISPNGDYIIFTSHGFEDHYGNGDLYISFRKDDNSWTQAINMGPEINTEATEYCPNVSPDEKYFFFTSNKKGTEDIYWVDGAIIDQLRSTSLRSE